MSLLNTQSNYDFLNDGSLHIIHIYSLIELPPN